MTNVIELSMAPTRAVKCVAAEVRAAIARAGFDQADVASRATVSTSTLSRRLKPQTIKDAFHVDELERIATVLGVSVTTFFATVEDQGPDDGGAADAGANRRQIELMQ